MDSGVQNVGRLNRGTDIGLAIFEYIKIVEWVKKFIGYFFYFYFLEFCFIFNKNSNSVSRVMVYGSSLVDFFCYQIRLRHMGFLDRSDTSLFKFFLYFDLSYFGRLREDSLWKDGPIDVFSSSVFGFASYCLYRLRLRKNFKWIFFKKVYRRQFVNKLICSLLLGSYWRSVCNLECRLASVLYRSGLVGSFIEGFRFIKKGAVVVNSRVLKQAETTIRIGDCISLCFNKFILKYFLTRCLLIDGVYSIRRLQLKKACGKQYRGAAKKKYFCIYGSGSYLFKGACPLFLEVDYQIMTVGLVRLPLNISEISFINKWMVNWYFLRFYSWGVLM